MVRLHQRLLLLLHLEGQHLSLVPLVIVWEVLRVVTHRLSSGSCIEPCIPVELLWRDKLLIGLKLLLLEFILAAELLLLPALRWGWHLRLLSRELRRHCVEWHGLVVECLCGVHHLLGML